MLKNLGTTGLVDTWFVGMEAELERKVSTWMVDTFPNFCHTHGWTFSLQGSRESKWANVLIWSSAAPAIWCQVGIWWLRSPWKLFTSQLPCLLALFFSWEIKAWVSLWLDVGMYVTPKERKKNPPNYFRLEVSLSAAGCFRAQLQHRRVCRSCRCRLVTPIGF